MRDRTGGYDPTIPPPGRPGPEHYCDGCQHMKFHHGSCDYAHSRPGCWWCPCAEDHAAYNAAIEKARAS